MQVLGIILAFVAVALIIGSLIWYNENQAKLEAKKQAERKAKALKLKERYMFDLLNSSKKGALESGRAYMSFIRGGELTVYDELALNNDLNCMK